MPEHETGSTSRNAYTPCDKQGCQRSPANGYALFRVSPKGQPGVFMCRDHATDDEVIERRPKPPPRVIKTRPGFSAWVCVGDPESFTMSVDDRMTFYPNDVREIASALNELADWMSGDVGDPTHA
jgi:hypothetical protein